MFCHIPKIESIGFAHLSKINREAGCKNQPMEPYWQKTPLSVTSKCQMPNAIMPNAKCQFHQFAELMELAFGIMAFGIWRK